MARKRKQSAPTLDYIEDTHRPVHSMVIVAGLLVFFHIGAWRLHIHFIPQQDVGRVLAWFGATGPLLSALAVLGVLTCQQIASRSSWKPRPLVLAGMLGESLLWTLPLVAISLLKSHVCASVVVTPLAGRTPLEKMVFFVGAGVYEEFIFRLVMIGVLTLLFADVLKLPEAWVFVGAVLFSSLAFGAYHFWPNGMPFSWSRFIFLATAGVLWGILVIYRGFAVAVGSHILWNIYAAFL